MKFFKFYFIFLLLPFFLKGQYKFPEKGFVFDDTSVPRIDIDIEPAFLEFLFNEDNLSSDTEYPATFYFTRGEEQDIVEKVGFRLRGNTSRSADKKSFKISFNYEVQGQKYRGLEKINLNGEHNDPSIMRSKMCWDLYTDFGIPGSRSNHVAFYINGEYRGLYLNVEHIDEEFLKKRFTSNKGNLYKCLYPADLLYKGDDPQLYKEFIFGKRAYELKTNEEADDYSDLAHFIDVLNNSSDEEFTCQVESVFDVDNYLKVIVMDILASNWDGHIVNKNNFYLYHDPKSDRFIYLPYDLDNTMGIAWGSVLWWQTDIYNWADSWGDVDRPLYERIMAVPEYRNKVTYYLEQHTLNVFNNDYLDSYLDDFMLTLGPFRENDVFASLDYGWTPEAFEKSFDQGVANHAPLGIKQYIDQRSTSARTQLDIEDPLALLEYYNYKWNEDKIDFNLKVEFPWLVTGSARLHYQVNEAEWMSRDMILGSDATFQASIQHGGLGDMLYYFEVNNFAGSIKFPNCILEKIPLGLEASEHPVINELLASNQGVNADEAGEFEDWIELYNPSDSEVLLSNYYLTDDIENPGKWQIDGDLLGIDSYFTVWADEDGDQGTGHSNFKLSKSGEFLGLYFLKEGVYFVVDSLTFPAQETDISYGRIPNGSGDFQVLSQASFGSNNEGSSSTIELESHFELGVYPNPSSGRLYVNVKDGFDFIEGVHIYNSMGMEVFKDLEINSPIIDLDLRRPQMESGIYFLKVFYANGRHSVKRIMLVD